MQSPPAALPLIAPWLHQVNAAANAWFYDTGFFCMEAIILQNVAEEELGCLIFGCAGAVLPAMVQVADRNGAATVRRVVEYLYLRDAEGTLAEPSARALTTVFGKLIPILRKVDTCRRDTLRAPFWVEAPLAGA